LNLKQLQALCGLIREVMPLAIIGGGAPRDAFLGGAIKDIDVFVQCDQDKFASLCEALAAKLGGTITGNAAYVHAPSYDIDVPGFPPLNVIQRGICVIDDLDDYDFGICQIAVTPSEVLKTSRFLKDIANNTVTYTHADAVREDWHVQSSTKRLGRILAKYPSLLPNRCEKLTVLPF
jgi:hypothetical protein